MKLISYYINSFKVYFSSKRSIDEIHDHHSWSTALIAGIILSFIIDIINLFLSSTNINLLSLILLIPSVLLYSFWIFVGILIIWILLKFFGGKAKYEDLLKFWVSMSITPTIIISIISLSFEHIFNFSNSSIIFISIMLIISLWTFYLSIIIYSLLSQINKLRTFLALVPILLFFIFLIIGSSNQAIIWGLI